MRLIDADALMQYLTSRKCECVDDVGKSWNYGIDTAIRVVDQCITIDAEPVRHGHWIDAYYGIETNFMFMYGICSECGFKQGLSNKLHYCPRCGAKMDEEGGAE